MSDRCVRRYDRPRVGDEVDSRRISPLPFRPSSLDASTSRRLRMHSACSLMIICMCVTEPTVPPKMIALLNVSPDPLCAATSDYDMYVVV